MYRDLVRFDRKGGAASGYVKTAAAWAPLITVAANIVAEGSGKEDVIAEKVRGVSGFAITVRDCAALSDLTTADRGVNARTGVIYDLRHIDRETGRADLIITADTGTPTEGG